MGNELVGIRGWHIASAMAVHVGTLLAFSFWVGLQARQIAINTERITVMEQKIASIEENGTTSSRIRLNEVIQRLKDLDDQVKEIGRNIK